MDAEGVLAQIDLEGTKRTLMEMIDIPSPTGSEAALGEYLSKPSPLSSSPRARIVQSPSVF